MKIIIEPYNPNWPLRFQKEAETLKNVFQNDQILIEHIGSTSVKGLGAKPVIDIMVGLPDFQSANNWIAPLEAVGFVYVSKFEDTMPFRRFFTKEESQKRLVNLHMVQIGTPFWNRHLRFRDHLRWNKEDRHKYNLLKLDLSYKNWSSVNDYAQAKTAFIRAVEAKTLAEGLLREARQDDIPQIMDVRLAVKENTLSDPNQVTAADCTDYMFRRGKGWVCAFEDKVAGFAVADLQENNVWALFVHPDHAEKGIGKRLHKTMLDWYFSQTETTLWLGTDPGTRAEGFYKKLGWKEVGKRDNGELRLEMNKSGWERNR